MANVPAAGPANLDPQAAIQKHAAVTQSGAAGDQAIITRIETSIRNSPMGWLQAQFGEVNSRASSEKGQINSKVSEQRELVASNQKDAPPDAGSAPTLGAPARPAVSQPSSAGAAKGGPVQPQGGAAAAGPTKGAKVDGKGVQTGPRAGHAAPVNGGLAGQMAGAQNDAQLDGMLNAYNPKGQQATEMIGRIKQMGSVAEGFRGQLDVYVAQGAGLESTLAGAANFFGVGRDASAVWATNPYRKMHGFLGGVMTGMSALQSVTRLVGSICGKLGLVLTVVGLLGMIFPPIGAAVSGIARILNVVGLICEAISFVLSGVLTGLNGVVLAKQIASGASAEEKAATADLMMSEANAAAGGLINVAMTFGPKFMKGLTAGSRGVISSLMRRFKAVVGRVSLRLTGNVRNFANRIVRRLGFGGAKMTRSGGAWVDKGFAARAGKSIAESRTSKVFNSAPRVIDNIQNKLMTKYGNTAWAKRLDRVGAWSGAAAKKFDLDEKVGTWGESAGKRVGGLGANTKFGKSLAKAADASERETREAAMKIAQRDAIHLEETRWRNQRQIQNASPENANKLIDRHTSAVANKHQADFDLSEKNPHKTERAALRDKEKFGETSDKFWENDKKGSRTYRDEYMDKVHKSREKRWKLEEKHRVSDEQRKKLLEIERRTPVQEKELTKLNQQLKNLDQARTTNLSREAELAKLSGLKQREVHNWKDVGTNVWNAVEPIDEMGDLSDGSKKWRNAERARGLRWNRGDAAFTARSRGGAGEYAQIKANHQRAQAADFAAFVQLGRPTATVAQATRSMLSSINRTPSAAPRQAAVPTTAPTPAPAPSPSPAASTASTVASSMPAASSTPAAPAASTSATPTAVAQTPSPVAVTPTPAPPALAEPQAPMPAPVPEGDEGGGEPLPYWPALLPEFDKAMTDFGFMRGIATEFKKAQIAGKQQAIETLAVYGRYEEYAKKRQEQAKANQTASQQTHANTQENSGAAGQATAQAGRGEAKQGEAKGAANSRAAVDLPEPETRGFWGRILGAVKRWAKNKAAQIFGWIQEKVASVVLRGLCGVSMGDLREYGGALRRQQQSAGQVATGAVQRSGTAAQQNVKLSADASKESQGAADAIGECDKNIVEADQFMGDVTSFEAQLTQEKAHAQAFLGQVQAAVHAEQARKRAEAEQQAQQEAAEAQRQQQAAQGEGGDGEGPVPSPHPTPAAGGDADGEGADPSADADHDGMPDGAEAEAARAQIVAAADFVKDSAARMEIQVQGRADDYQNQLVLALTNRTGDDAQGNDLEGPAKKASKHILDEFKAFVDETKQEMGQFRGMSIDPASAGRIADTVITQAEHLDANYNQSMEALDELFERTYTGIRDGRRDLQTRTFGGDNMLGDFNRGVNDLTDRAYDAVSPTMDAAWDTVSAPLRQAPLPDSSAVQGPGAPPASGPSQ